MANLQEEIRKALLELRKDKERKFNQTVDLIFNLQKFDVRKNSINLFITIPNKVKEKKIGAFLESKNKSVDAITKDEFKKYSNKNELKRLIGSYDFFIAQANLMPMVATTFGRVLGPTGKMPSPQLGIITNADEKSISDLKDKINHTLKTKIKESSIKFAVGKQKMKDEEITDNIMAVYNTVIKELPKGKDNLKNMEIKFTMTKPIKISLK